MKNFKWQQSIKLGAGLFWAHSHVRLQGSHALRPALTLEQIQDGRVKEITWKTSTSVSKQGWRPRTKSRAGKTKGGDSGRKEWKTPRNGLEGAELANETTSWAWHPKPASWDLGVRVQWGAASCWPCQASLWAQGPWSKPQWILCVEGKTRKGGMACRRTDGEAGKEKPPITFLPTSNSQEGS